MKKKQKPTEKHYFARICRTLGRFCMCIGAIFAIGGIILAVLRLVEPNFANELSGTYQRSTGSVVVVSEPQTTEINTTSQFLLIIISALITAVAIAIFWRALKSYNNALRKGIAKIAKAARAPIFGTEIVLTLAFWLIAAIFITREMPLIGLCSLAILIINELLFVFAWASYGRPVYTL